MSIPLLRTTRMWLRPWERRDADALHTLWTSPDVRRYLWDDIVISRDTAEQVVESHLASSASYGIGFWALYVLPSGLSTTCIDGFCGFRLIDEGPEIEMMYGLRGQHWGKGLATEACAAAIDYLWRSTHYQRVYARTDPPNQKSVQVMLRLGMIHDSTTELTITYLLRRPE